MDKAYENVSQRTHLSIWPEQEDKLAERSPLEQTDKT